MWATNDRPLAATVAAVYAGRRAPLGCGPRVVESAVVKSICMGAAFVGTDGLADDEQADRHHHGGPMKALLAYPIEHYAGHGPAAHLPVGTLGENLSIRGLLETSVRIGDIFAVGDAIVKVTQPRRPCFKLGLRHQSPTLPRDLESAGHTGFYLRVLRPGFVMADAPVILIARARHVVTVAEVNRVMNVDKSDLAGIRNVLHARDDLPPHWHAQLQRRLAGAIPGDDLNRLDGECGYSRYPTVTGHHDNTARKEDSPA